MATYSELEHRVKRTFVAHAPHGHKGWRIYDTMFVQRLDEDGYPLTFEYRDSARRAIGRKVANKPKEHNHAETTTEANTASVAA